VFPTSEYEPLSLKREIAGFKPLKNSPLE